MLFCHFRKFDFSNFKITFAKTLMKKTTLFMTDMTFFISYVVGKIFLNKKQVCIVPYFLNLRDIMSKC